MYIKLQLHVNYGGHSYQRLLQLCIFRKCLRERKSHNSDIRTAMTAVGNKLLGNSNVLLSVFPLDLRLAMWDKREQKKNCTNVDILKLK
jgi:hypothetical protein